MVIKLSTLSLIMAPQWLFSAADSNSGLDTDEDKMIGMFQDGFREQNIFIESSVEYQEFESVGKKVRYFFVQNILLRGRKR